MTFTTRPRILSLSISFASTLKFFKFFLAGWQIFSFCLKKCVNKNNKFYIFFRLCHWNGSCLLLLISLKHDCFGATTRGRNTAFAPVSTNSNSPGSRNSRPTVMHPAFANAGKTPGTEIWRVEVIKIKFIHLFCFSFLSSSIR